MTAEEINEIKEAIAHIKHADEIPGKYYDLCRAVLPLLEHGLDNGEYALSPVAAPMTYSQTSIYRYALNIARVINLKQRMTILEEKGKKGMPTFQEIQPGTKQPTKYTSKMLKSKPAPKLHPEIAKRLKKEGRIIEKGKGK